jgi:zinc metalloprotease ZmpB
MPRRRGSRLALALSLIASATLIPAGVLARQPAAPCPVVRAKVFMPNPVASSGNPNLQDNRDRDSVALNSQRVTVELMGLNESGFLRGRWATVVSSTGVPAFETDCTYFYTRRDDRFEQVMAYYWVTRSQLYLRSLGFDGSPFPEVNADRQRVRINQWGQDNSFATTHPRDEMRFGKKGVDDAEDGDVILHELGHQIHFSQSPGGFSGSDEADAIGEGFGDYWAFTVSKAVAGPQFDEACIAKWDATSYDTPEDGICLRRLDSDLMYDDLDGTIHRDGQVWSHALRNLHEAIGQAHADTAILVAQFGWIGTDMPDLAERTVDAVHDLYGAGQSAAAQGAFAERGIL